MRRSLALYFEAGRLAMRPYQAQFTYDAHLDVWVGKCPELDGCMTQGGTLDEARLMLYDARTLWIEHSLLNGLDVPTPKGLVGEIVMHVYDGQGNRV